MYTRILVPVDGSVASAQALVEAIELARHLKARLQLVHIVEPWIMITPAIMPGTVHEIAEGLRSSGAALLEECKKKVTTAGIEVDTELAESAGRLAGEIILRKAKEVDAPSVTGKRPGST